MKSVLLSVFLLTCAGASAAASNPTTVREVRSALYCLTRGTTQLLPHMLAEKYVVTYVYDRSPPSGGRVLLLFVKSEHQAYDAFVIAVSGPVFDLQNNAELSNGRDGVNFVSDPLGGIWTHDYIAANFTKALKKRPQIVSVDPSFKPSPICRKFGSRSESR